MRHGLRGGPFETRKRRLLPRLIYLDIVSHVCQASVRCMWAWGVLLLARVQACDRCNAAATATWAAATTVSHNVSQRRAGTPAFDLARSMASFNKDTAVCVAQVAFNGYCTYLVYGVDQPSCEEEKIWNPFEVMQVCQLAGCCGLLPAAAD